MKLSPAKRTILEAFLVVILAFIVAKFIEWLLILLA